MTTPVWLSHLEKPRKALLVVTHPDDETIFAGGLLLCSEETRWTIICCTHASPRDYEFKCACDFFSRESGNTVESILFGLKEEDIDYYQLRKKLSLYRDKFDIVITHNSQGEYGNPDHILIHCFVINTILNPNTWVFISPGSSNVDQEVLKSKKIGGNFSLELSSEIRKLKIKTFQECHKSQARHYGYDETGQLRHSDLKETLQWEFEKGREEYTFFQ